MAKQVEIIFEDEWIATDLRVIRYMELVTGKPFPDPEKYYTVTRIYKYCDCCGRKGAHWGEDPIFEIEMWLCKDCYRQRYEDS